MVKGLVERTDSIDVNVLSKAGAFDGPVMNFPFLGLQTQRYLIRYRPLRAPLERPPQCITILWTRCHFGGRRPWFQCTGCGSRVGKLYPGFWVYLCRKCCNLSYQSQRMSPPRRLHTKAERLRRLMGDEGRPGIDDLPVRLPGKHRKQHRRKCQKLFDLESKLRRPGQRI
jgi:hypothetical protein